MYLLVLMLCTAGSHAVDLWRTLGHSLNTLFGINAVYLLVLMLCAVGFHAVDLCQHLCFL